MSLLDDARRLDNEWIGIDTQADGVMRCQVCEAIITATPENRAVGHQSHCVLLSMSRIVAALEAVERAVSEWGVDGRCPFCGPRLQRKTERRHADVCPWMALVDALKDGEDVTP